LFESFVEKTIDRLAGLYTFVRDVDVPRGWSPSLQNVRFRPGSVETRPGLTNRFTKDTGNISLNGQYGLAQFINNLGNKSLLSLDALGDLYIDSGAQMLLLKEGVANPTSMMKSVLAFNRIYESFYGAGLVPGAPVRSYDGTNVDHLAPSGPAAPGSAIDGAPPAKTIAAAPDGAVRVSNVATIKTTTAHGMVADQTVTIAGVTDATFDGVVLIVDVIDSVTFTYANAGADTTSGGGTATCVGEIEVGDHQFIVLFETRSGYITERSPAGKWTSAGATGVAFSALPTGPSYVVARRIAIGASGDQENFFFLPRFRVPDNTSTTFDLNFTDSELLQGENYNRYSRNFRLPDQAGIAMYNQRIVAFGGLNTVKMLNLDFDGGFATGGEPLGWRQRAGFAGGAKSALGFAGDCWRITGANAVVDTGEIGNPEAATKLLPNTSYSVSIRARLSAAFTPNFCKMVVDVVGTGVDTHGIEVPLDPVNFGFSTKYKEFSAVLTSELAVIPPDLQLRVYVKGVAGINFNAGDYVEIDRIQVWPTNIKYDASVLRISDPENADRFDSINGFVVIQKDDGQRIVAGVQHRSYFYVFKERSTHTTEDDGISPPSLWPTSLADSEAGAASPNAIDLTSEFIITASRAGAYMFRGPTGLKLSQEIQTTWNRINWNVSEKIHTLIDPEKEIVMFFVPLDADIKPRHAIILDYSQGWEEGDRKWGLDYFNADANLLGVHASICLETSTKRQALYFAIEVNGAFGAIVENAGTDDYGHAIDSFYETAYVRQGEGGTDLYGGAAFLVSGSGTFTSSIRGMNDVAVANLTGITLAAGPPSDVERQANLETDRARLRFGTNAVGAFFQCKRLRIYTKAWAKQGVT